MATNPPSDEASEIAVRIGIREIYDHVRDLVRSVDGLSRQIDRLTTDVSVASQGANTLETRVRALETQRVVTPASMWTAIGVLTSVAGVLVALITIMVQR
jgi:chromosome segregation ATPase